MKLRKFKKGDKFFFQMLNDASEVILESQAYTSQDARDNGIESVRTNIKNADRYETITDGGQQYFILKAGNNQEVARSKGYTDAAALNSALKYAQTGDDGGQAYGTDGRTDDYKPLSFYQTNAAGVENGFDTFSAEGEHYFTYNLNNTIYLISEGYKTEASRDNGVKSVEKNFGTNERYQSQSHPNGKYFFNLKAGNNQEIATSIWFDSAADRDLIIGRLTGAVSEGTTIEGDVIAANRAAKVTIAGPPPPKEAAPKKKRKKRTTEKKPKAEKVYLSKGNYHFNDVTYDVFRSGNNKHYFTFKNTDGKTILLNSNVRGFDEQAQADATIEDVLKYGPIESNYEGKMTRNGKYYFYLNGEDGGHIAKSFFFDTEEDMQKTIGSLLGTGAVAAAPKDAPKAKKVEDDYLACKVYQSHISNKHSQHDDFIIFTEGDEHYFAWVSGDEVLMRSEGYTTQKARENGVESVIKNRDIEERFSVDEKIGHFFTVLKAGNHQEIARSCPHKDRNGAMYWFPSAIKKRDEEAKALAAKEVPAPAPKAEKREDDYLHCSFYEGKQRSKEYSDFSLFERDGEHYFALLDNNDKVVLRSEGYKSEKGRENGIQSVLKNREIEKRWGIDENRGVYFNVLKAGNHQEIGRSCPMKDKPAGIFKWGSWAIPAAAKAPAPKAEKREDDYLHCSYYEGKQRSKEYSDFSLFERNGEHYFALLDNKDKVVLRSEGYKSSKGRENGIQSVLKNREIDKRWSVEENRGIYFHVLKAGNHQEIGRSCPMKDKPGAFMWGSWAVPAAAAAIPAVPKDKEDDYLACKVYEGRKVNDKKNNVALFKHDGDGQYYFALYDENGDVKLRSEGFRSATERDEELSGVLKYHNTKDMYKRITRGKYYMDVLYDKTGREVGRSCLKTEKKAVPVVAKAAAVAAVIPPKKKVVAAKAAPIIEEEASGGWFKWWMLLPLLLPLLWLMCNKCKTEAVVPPVVKEVVVPEPVVEVEEPVVEETPPPVVGCQCDSKNISIFDVPSSAAVSLDRLGTLPEFGNSHGLSASQFYSKLSDRYNSNAVDKAYLDFVFRSMGYTNGFRSANASLFSDVTLDRGQSGLLGFGEYHGYGHYALNTTDRDRQAFMIKAANGCDVHFMKTCGNYMFFCD